jgi:glycogen phosphorylase
MEIARIASGFTPIPDRISRILELAYNLWWSWNPQAQDLFRAIDESLWEEIYHNPVHFLRDVRQSTLESRAHAPEFLRTYHSVMADFDSYMTSASTCFGREHPDERGPIAYFSAEFGLHEALPIYSGGLGILSGDHCKEASDLGLPLIGVGFLYPQGYFRQRINANGDQEATYEKLDFSAVPALPAFDRDGKEIVITVALPGRTVYAKVWKIQVGRVPLYLMDTDIHPNAPPDRHLSARLYGGDREMRLSQEMVLGIGGVRTLKALGIKPKAWHVNEGHPAFVLLEHARDLIRDGHSFEEAKEIVKAESMFTTHTPVPAGHDVFSFDLMDRFFQGYWEELGLSRDQFLDIARQDQAWGPVFSMTVLGLKMAGDYNGVSQLHGTVSRKMWQFLWPGRSVEEVPIRAITNGVHTASWLAPELKALFDRYLPSDWMDNISDKQVWEPISSIPDDELWRIHQDLRRKLVEFVRHRMHFHLWRLGAEDWQLANTPTLFDPNILTIGFARRFATYKRATLIFTDVERLKKILNQPGKAVQIIFAGKAHPADEPGKDLIRQVYQYSKEPGLAGRIVFLENYDINMARYLVQGCDIWLNNPRRPNEASGTSGQKAALNGVPNLSISDGWWAEGYNGENGWVIGDGVDSDDSAQQDWEDSQSLYTLLEKSVVPAFYDRGDDGVPKKWLALMKNSIRTLAPVFSTCRMIQDYTSEMYLPTMERST